MISINWANLLIVSITLVRIWPLSIIRHSGWPRLLHITIKALIWPRPLTRKPVSTLLHPLLIYEILRLPLVEGLLFFSAEPFNVTIPRLLSCDWLPLRVVKYWFILKRIEKTSSIFVLLCLNTLKQYMVFQNPRLSSNEGRLTS